MDFITTCHQGGMFHILEPIFLGLSHKTLDACRKVSPQWANAVNDVLRYDLPRIRDFLEEKLVRSWVQDEPLLVESAFGGMVPSDCGSIVADDRHVAADVRFGMPLSENAQQRILILNSQTLRIVKVLQQDRLPVAPPHYLRISMNDHYLVVCRLRSDFFYARGSPLEYNVWNRMDNFSKVPVAIKGHIPISMYFFRNLGDFETFCKPLLHGSGLQVPVTSALMVDNNVCQYWNLSTRTYNVREVARPNTVAFVPVGRYFALIDRHSVGLFEDGFRHPKWTQTRQDYEPKILGQSEEHVGICWYIEEIPKFLMLCRMDTGEQLSEITFSVSIRRVWSVQISHQRVGILQSRNSVPYKNPELFIYDLETGESIFVLESRTGIRHMKCYALLKNKVIFFSRGKICAAVLG